MAATNFTIPVDDAGFTDMDMLKAVIDGLPKIQQAIIHAHIEAKFEIPVPTSEHARRRAQWLYDSTS